MRWMLTVCVFVFYMASCTSAGICQAKCFFALLYESAFLIVELLNMLVLFEMLACWFPAAEVVGVKTLALFSRVHQYFRTHLAADVNPVGLGCGSWTNIRLLLASFFSFCR